MLSRTVILRIGPCITRMWAIDLHRDRCAVNILQQTPNFANRGGIMGCKWYRWKPDHIGAYLHNVYLNLQANSLHLRAYHQLWDKGHPQFGRKSGVRVVPLKSPWHTHNLSPSRYVISPILRTNRHTSFAWDQPPCWGYCADCGTRWSSVASCKIPPYWA